MRFSNNVVQILNSLGVEFGTFDVLSDFEVEKVSKNILIGLQFLKFTKGEFLVAQTSLSKCTIQVLLKKNRN